MRTPPLPPTLKVVKFLWWMRTLLNRMENQFFDFFSSYDWSYLQFYSDTSDFSSVSPIKKKIVQKWSKLQEICAMCWNEGKIIFPIFSFWVMVDFVLKIQRELDDFEYKIDHISRTKNRKIDFLFVSAHSASLI